MKKIIFTHSINSIVSKFTSLFLAIYFLKITDGNIASVVLYYLIKYAFVPVSSFVILKFINKNNVLKLYRLGILSNGVCLIVLLILGQNITNYIYLYALLDSFTNILYWSPYKMILYNFKNDKELKNIFSYNSILTSIISILSTIGMGYVIVNLSYSALFIIIFALTLVAVIVSFRIGNDYEFSITKMKISNFKYILKDKQATEINKLVFFEGCGYRGGLDTAITLLIFLSLGSEASLGNLSAVFAFLGLITANLVKKFLKEKDNGKAFFIASLLILIATIPIIFTTSFKVFIIYNIIFSIGYKITQIVVDSSVFNISSNKTINNYKVEYTFINESIHALGKVVSELILLLIVMFLFTYQNMQIVVAVLSCSILIQAFIYKRFEKIKERAE